MSRIEWLHLRLPGERHKRAFAPGDCRSRVCRTLLWLKHVGVQLRLRLR